MDSEIGTVEAMGGTQCNITIGSVKHLVQIHGDV
jgi:hypothetical protein